MELLSNEACKGGPDHGSREGVLGDSGGPKVNVLHVLVGRAVGVHRLEEEGKQLKITGSQTILKIKNLY